jgi:acyl-CoA reductase-like NAD-dependent aldehyde dehydrogenase
MSVGVTGNLVRGKIVTTAAGGTIDVTDPADLGTMVGAVPAMTETDLRDVFDAAEQGAAVWRGTDSLRRARVLFDAAAIIRSDAGDLTDLIVAEMGKTRIEASGEVGKAAEFFEYYAGLGRLPFGELLPDGRPDTYALQVREPLGIVVLITPWNDPLLTPARKLAPALISGNAVVIKPATDTPLVMLRLADILNRAGLPAGALGTVTGRGADIGVALTDDQRIAAVSFTGSTSVGIELQRRLAGTGIRVQTEMGGKNAAVILSDADLDLAIPTVIVGAYGQAGQRCTATSRLIVERGIAAQVRERVAEAVRGLRVGPGSDPATSIGPVISARARTGINEMIGQALDEGAGLVAAGELPAGIADKGAYVAPLLLEVNTSNSAWHDEIFGPVVAMLEVDDLDAAIAAVNDSAYGLSSAVFTRSLESAHRFIAEVNTGQVSVNQPTSGWDVHEPFGGFKDSGSPFKEQGLEALRFYTRVKTAAIRTR